MRPILPARRGIIVHICLAYESDWFDGMPRGLVHLWIVIHDLVSVVVRFLPLRFASLQTHRWLPVRSVRMPAGLAAERDEDGWRRRLLRFGLPAPRTDSAKARTSVSSPVVVWDESLIVSEYSMTGNTSMPRTCRRNGCFVGS